MKSRLSALCKTCGNCCKSFVIASKKPLQKAVMEDWLDKRGVQIVAEDHDAIYLKIDLPCPHLVKSDDGWSCDIYHNRPSGCRDFDGTKYDFLKCKWKEIDHVILEKAKREKPFFNYQK